MATQPIDDHELTAALDVLRRLQGVATDDPAYLRAEQAVAHFTKTTKKRRRTLRAAAARSADRRIDESTLVFQQAAEAAVSASEGSAGLRSRDRRCYICKARYRSVDAHYHLLCPPCALRNRTARQARSNLLGRRAVVTGGRIKIGLETSLRLLRAGAEVAITTRFPVDAQHVYAAQPDAVEWIDRLVIVKADFLKAVDVADLIEMVADRWDHIDILVNNAAQTIRRSPDYYNAVMTGEARTAPALAATCWSLNDVSHQPAIVVAGHALQQFGVELDESGQPLDRSATNSWKLQLHDVEPSEWLETYLIGSFVPYLLIRGLRPLMLASPHADRYVVNVTAMEGAFARQYKGPGHPHTNAAKASLNMITRTIAETYATDGVFVTSVDTGWITDERPHREKERQRAAGFRPPLDPIDGAARVCHPIEAGVAGQPMFGVFLKDYEVAPW